MIIIVVVLVVVRLLLPGIVLHYANKTLANMKGYRGHIKDIDIALIRGAYKIDSMYLDKVDSASGKQTPFFGAQTIDLSVEWKALFHGSFVGEMVFDDVTLAFTKDRVEPQHLKKDSTSFKDLKQNLMPIQVNRFEVNNGKIRYIDHSTKPNVDIAMNDVHILAENLRNSYDSSVLLPAKIQATASVYDGRISMTMKSNPLAKTPTFDVNAEADNINLVKLNEFFQAYAKVDVNKGTFGLYTEVAAKDGKFDGYVKPLIHHLDVLGKEDRKDNIFQKMWEGFVGTVGDLFTNPPKNQFATKVPLKGSVKDPDANIWYAIVEIAQNAFVQALQPRIDQEINIATVDAQPKEEKKTFLQKIFGKKDKGEKKKEEKK